jgi:hypothetical protein
VCGGSRPHSSCSDEVGCKAPIASSKCGELMPPTTLAPLPSRSADDDEEEEVAEDGDDAMVDDEA